MSVSTFRVYEGMKDQRLIEFFERILGIHKKLHVLFLITVDNI